MTPTYDRLQSVFRECFEDDAIILAPGTSSADIPGWDSLMHVTLILAVEREFGVRFRGSEVDGMKQVADLVAAVDQHLAE